MFRWHRIAYRWVVTKTPATPTTAVAPVNAQSIVETRKAFSSSLHNPDPLRSITGTAQTSVAEVYAIKRIIQDTTQIKRTHLLRDNDIIAQEARRKIASVDIAAMQGADSVSALTPRNVVQLLANATYFGFTGNDAVVQQALEWIGNNLNSIQSETISHVIFACASVQTKKAREIVEILAKRCTVSARYMSCQNITHVLSAFAKVRYSNERLFFSLSRRIITLCRIGGFENELLVPLLDSVARAKIRSTPVTNALMNRIQYGKDPLVYSPDEFVLVLYSFARLRLRDEKFIRRLSFRAVDLTEHFSALHVSSCLHSFAMLGYKFENLIAALSTRCSEVMNEFTARYVAVTLQSFRRLHCNSPELFDALAERALAVVPQHTARDIAAVVSSLEFFSLADEELFQKLAEHAMTVVHDFSVRGIVEVLHSFARIQYRHVPLLSCMWERCGQLLPMLDASEVRRVLYSIARFQAHVSHQGLANALFQRCMTLHPDLFLTTESIQEADVIFQTFGKDYCPDLYAFFLSRSAALAAAPPPPPRTVRNGIR
eukprot:PhF_6_TR31384/c0_g1_i1/m.45966